MRTDVGVFIADLLYENDSVVVPGLGGFVTGYQPAEVDQVQGKLYPPSKDLNFNDNLVLDDGLLIKTIQEGRGISAVEAGREVAQYVGAVKAAIDRREIVVFPRVGRLYKDYAGKLQFLPENTNFNLDSFGLPAVQFFPLAASARRPAPEAPAVPAVPGPAAPGLSDTLAHWFQRFLPLIGALSIIIVAFGIYLFVRDNEAPIAPAEDKKNIPASRINTKPSVDSPEEMPGADYEGAAALDDPEDIADLQEEGEFSDGLDTEAATPAPGQRSAVIAVGLFGDPKNVNRLVEQIYKEGYEPYTESAGKLTRVGIQMAYDDYAQVERELQNIRNKFNKEAFVVPKK